MRHSPLTDDAETPASMLLACHARIRTYTAGLARLAAALPELGSGDPRVASAAAQAHRYFGEALLLHAVDEDRSIAPLLEGLDPALDAVMEGMAEEHVAIEAALPALLADLKVLMRGEPVDTDAFTTRVVAFNTLLLGHIDAEEASFVPAAARIGADEGARVVREMRARRAAA